MKIVVSFMVLGSPLQGDLELGFIIGCGIASSDYSVVSFSDDLQLLPPFAPL